VAEGVPTDPAILPCGFPALLVDRQATAVRNRAVLSAPNSDPDTAPWTLHQAAVCERLKIPFVVFGLSVAVPRLVLPFVATVVGWVELVIFRHPL